MVARYCPKCGRVTSTDKSVNFCAWGCGSLKDEPELPDIINQREEYYAAIEKIKKDYAARKSNSNISTNKPEQISLNLEY